VNYTYSHAQTSRYLGDYYTADSALVNFVTLRNPNLSRGPSPYDQRHTFRTFLTYDLPFGTGKVWKTGHGAIDHVIGGWTVGTIVTLQSGRNFKLQSGYNTFNYSNAYWPNSCDSGVVLNGMTASQLQSKVGLYPGPTPAEPKVFLPPSLLTQQRQRQSSCHRAAEHSWATWTIGLSRRTKIRQHRHLAGEIDSDQRTSKVQYLRRILERV